MKVFSHDMDKRKKYARRFKRWRVRALSEDTGEDDFNLSFSDFNVGTRKDGKCKNDRLIIKMGKKKKMRYFNLRE